MTLSTIIIFLGWLAYGLFHSLLSSSQFKGIIEAKYSKLFSNYRLLFVVTAIVSPLPLLYYQFTTTSSEVWNNYREIRLFGGIIAGIGLAVLRKAFGSYDSKLFFGLSKAPENSEAFRSDGILAKVRHPLYTATLMLFWGWFLFSNSYHNLAFCLANTLYIIMGIQWEEKKLVQQYGQKYLDYKSNVPMLIPQFWKGK
ncbi:MAG: protein-S-isoprenylcysteine O-methyltransferase Ste14 [Arcticibacterium sp.]